MDRDRVLLVENTRTLVKPISQNSAQALAREIESRFNELESHNIASMRQLRREFSKQISTWTSDQVVELGLDLIKRNDLILRIFTLNWFIITSPL